MKPEKKRHKTPKDFKLRQKTTVENPKIGGFHNQNIQRKQCLISHVGWADTIQNLLIINKFVLY